MNVAITTCFPDGSTRITSSFERLDRQLKHEGIELTDLVVLRLYCGIPVVVEAWDMLIERVEGS